MAKTYRIGTRTSPLALKQVQEVLAALRESFRDFKAEVVGIDTRGDKDKITPISEIEGTDFFTREIDDALLKGRVDLVVHSAKDLPDSLRDGLVIAAITESIDPYDALVSRSGIRLKDLPYGAKIGTSSLRRKQGLRKFRRDFEIVDIRGNIQERLNALNSKKLDAIVIAAAGLIRLGLKDRISERIPFEILTPHSLQGALALQAREGDEGLISLLKELDKPKDEESA